MVVNAMDDDLGIGFGNEAIAFGSQLGAQRLVIFDDAVVRHSQPTGDMGMGVDLAGLAVSRPAGMGNARVAAQRSPFQRVPQRPDLAEPTQPAQLAAIDHGQPGGVVSPVLQPPQPLDEHRE